ncbi:hypothetical protein EYR40_005361 [Pleurotus pulmonarius]|nr:hypothetical protein EYR40_005361 [Pleurotus pulmonarius]
MAGSKKRKTAAASKTDEDEAPSGLLEIPEDEQWRMINESGILKKVDIPRGPSAAAEPEEELPLAEEIFDTTMFLVPFSFLLLMMDILIHNQYGRHLTLQAVADRMLPSVPILGVFIFYTMRHKRDRRVQFFLFALASFLGPRVLWLLSLGSWKVNMKQAPPLITLWVYTIVQLDLGPAVLNLGLTMAYVLLKGLKPFS